MSSITTIGSPSKTTFLATESHKLHLEFETSADVYKGQPVKLDSDGKVTPFLKTDAPQVFLGVSLFDIKSGEDATIAMRGYSVIYGIAKAANLDAGLVMIDSYDSSTDVGGLTGYNAFAALPTPDTGEDQDYSGLVGWNLTPVTAAGALIQVVIRD